MTVAVLSAYHLAAPHRQQRERLFLRAIAVDNSSVVTTILRDLVTDHGYQIAVCKNGRDAHDQLLRSWFDVVFTSVDLEGMDGADDYVRKPFDPAEVETRLRSAERFLKLQRDLIKLATRDPMTQTLNQRSFMDRALGDIQSAQENKHPLSVLMLDIDKFKSINDTYAWHHQCRGVRNR